MHRPDDEVSKLFDEETGGTGTLRSCLDLPDGEPPLRKIGITDDPNDHETGQIGPRGSLRPRDMIEILEGKPPT